MSHGTTTHPIEQSRLEILAEIGDPPDLALVEGIGNAGDWLINAGIAELLEEHIYRVLEVGELARSGGHTVVLAGGGAWCRPFHHMTTVLALAEQRFERVIVLPSSFDPSESTVRRALARTAAVVFARERESHAQIAPLCDARLAHDCAFFFDFEPYRRERGNGVLDAFRTDIEAAGEISPPPGNRDISLSATTLEEWLETIAAHELVRTDRAHVMIAAALLGRQVEYASSSYHKVPAIADYALREHDVRPLRAGVRRRAARPQRSPEPIGPELARRLASAPGAQPEGSRRRASAGRRVTAIVVSASNPGHALASARALDGASVVLIDSNSSDRDAAALEAGAAKLANVELRRFDRELGTAGTRRLALEEATGELVLLLDEGVIPAPGMVEALAGELDREAEAMAVAATVLDLEGSVVSSGGWVRLAGGALEMTALGRGLQFDDERLPPSGPSGWLPSPAALVRRTLLDEHPPDPACGRYHDADWSQRVSAQRPAALRRSREALAVRCLERPLAPGGWEAASAEVDALVDHAAFYARHRLVLANDLEAILPGLTRDGELDVARARLLLELVGAKGAAWTHAEWLGGRLAPLIEHDGGVGEAEFDWLRSRAATLAAVERGGWWRLRGRLLPLLRIASRARGRGAA